MHTTGMNAFLDNLPLAGLLGSLIAGLGTGLGALPILFRETWSKTAQLLMLAGAAGVMLGATVFSLVIPTLELVTERTGNDLQAALVASGGLLLGALTVWGVHSRVPHEHFVKGPEGRPTLDLGRHWLFILAITIHNVPEGMSVGVSYGGGFSTGLAVTLGIGLQNMPEGLAVAAALTSDGIARGRAFWLALATGMVEPLGGVVGALAVSISDALLPWGLAFAGGAMLFVVSGEVIPETHGGGNERLMTFSLVLGFVLMLILDVAIG